MKKYQVTHPKAFDEGKEVKIGAIVTLEDDEALPGFLVGKVKQVEEPEVEEPKKPAAGGAGDKK
jgi:hypothetical protein